MSKRAFITVSLGLALTMAAGFFGYASFLRVSYRADSALGHLRRAEATVKQSPADLLKRDALDRAIADLAAAEASLASIKREPLLSLVGLVGWVPRWGAEARAVVDLLDVALDTASAGRLAGEGLKPIVEAASGQTFALFGDSGFDTGLMGAMKVGKPSFEAAASKSEKARQRLKSVKAAEPTGALADGVKRLEALLPSLQAVVELGRAAPELTASLLGIDKPRRYLIISQNSEELRATGGFIAGVWLLGLAGGKIAELDFKDSSDVDDLSKRYPPPPPAVSKYMWGGVWLFRDANWSPDFPTSARYIEDFYKLGQDVSVDGVVAVDQQMLESVLSLTGPIFIREFQELVDAGNVVDKMVRTPGAVGPRGLEQTRAKKLFMAALFQELLLRIQSGLDADTAVKLGGLIAQAWEEKHLLMHFNDPTVQGLLHRSQRDGAIRPSEGDFLMVVDSNVAYRKLNARISASIRYDVSLGKDGTAQAKVVLNYKNNSTERINECLQDTLRGAAYEQWREGCYWDYVRVYVPKGAKLLQSSHIPMPKGSFWLRLGKAAAEDGAMLASPEGGKDVFDAFFDLAPGASREVSFSYGLPSLALGGARANRYELLVQKQPGTPGIPVRVGVSLPPGAKIVSAEPTPLKTGAGHVEFQADLTRDLKFVIAYLVE
ncbi:MAG: DUF4012 domain-containing protein [Chloroflexi bacterium]|nr:DUF4012 domain-containing protein [Chloroflexota bacterium]